MSRAVTLAPAARKAETAADPMKPAPPVTTTWLLERPRSRLAESIVAGRGG